MRVFNKHYKPKAKNPRSVLVNATAQSFKRLLAKNPGKYEELYEEFFGAVPEHDSRKVTPLADRYQSLLSELSLLNTVELELIKKRVDQAAEGVASAKLDDQIRKTTKRRESVERDIDRAQRQIMGPSAPGRRIKKGKGSGVYRYGSEEAKRMEKLERQSKKEFGIRDVESRRGSETKIKLDRPVRLGIFSGIVHSPYEDDLVDLYRWELFTPAHELVLSGATKRHGSSAQALRHGYEIVENLSKGGEVSRDRRRWLEGSRVSEKSASEVRVHPAFEKLDSAAALGRRGGIQKYEAPSRGIARKFGHGVPSLSLGEEEEVRGQAYSVFARRDREGYWIKVHTKPDSEGDVYETGWSGPFKSLEKAYLRANALGGALTGAREFIEANPAVKRSMYRQARSSFAKANPGKRGGFFSDLGGPKIDRVNLTGEEGFSDLVEAMGVPRDSEDAYRVGYAWGIIRGIDTCGVQNLLKRRKLRKTYEKEILSAFKSMSEGIVKRGHRQGEGY